MPQLGGDVAAQVGVDGVGDPHQVLEHPPAGRGGRSSERLRLFRLNVSKNRLSSPSLNGRDVAADVAAGARVLDLDDLGAEVGQVQAAVGAGAVLLEGEDPDVFQGPHGPTLSQAWGRTSASMARTSASAGSALMP